MPAIATQSDVPVISRRRMPTHEHAKVLIAGRDPGSCPHCRSPLRPAHERSMRRDRRKTPQSRTGGRHHGRPPAFPAVTSDGSALRRRAWFRDPADVESFGAARRAIIVDLRATGAPLDGIWSETTRASCLGSRAAGRTITVGGIRRFGCLRDLQSARAPSTLHGHPNEKVGKRWSRLPRRCT
jgi:hypothetical protein